MKRVTAEKFRAAFADEWRERVGDAQTDPSLAFASNKRWSKYMLDSDGGFLSGVLERLNRDRALRYCREYYTVDALFVGGEDLLGRNGGYPSELHVLIEHENDEWVEEEMWKLIHWRAPLKVLIFYDWSDKQRSNSKKRAKWLGEKLRRLREMLATVNSFFPECEETEYLFVIAAKTEGGQIYWRWASSEPGESNLLVGA